MFWQSVINKKTSQELPSVGGQNRQPGPAFGLGSVPWHPRDPGEAIPLLGSSPLHLSSVGTGSCSASRGDSPVRWCAFGGLHGSRSARSQRAGRTRAWAGVGGRGVLSASPHAMHPTAQRETRKLPAHRGGKQGSAATDLSQGNGYFLCFICNYTSFRVEI